MTVAHADSSALSTLAADPQLQRKPRTFWSMALQSLRRDPVTLVAIGFLITLAALSLVAPAVAAGIGVGPNDTNLENAFQQPYWGPYIQWRTGQDPTTAPLMLGKSGGVPHWLGTDQLGRDQFVRLLYGGRVSLGIAFAAAALTLILGMTVGTVAGFFGGVVDDLIMWFVNTLTVSIPGHLPPDYRNRHSQTQSHHPDTLPWPPRLVWHRPAYTRQRLQSSRLGLCARRPLRRHTRRPHHAAACHPQQPANYHRKCRHRYRNSHSRRIRTQFFGIGHTAADRYLG